MDRNARRAGRWPLRLNDGNAGTTDFVCAAIAVQRSSANFGDEHVTHIDAQILQELIDAHGAALTLYARQWCRSPEDAVQEALIDLLRQDPVPENIAAWLYTTVRRRAMNWARAEGRRAKHHQQAGHERQSWFLPPKNDFDHSWDNPVDFESLLARLPALEREIIVARIWGERSFAEISEIVEKPISTVHRRYQRALDALERMINESEHSRENHSRDKNESQLPLS